MLPAKNTDLNYY